MNYNQFTKTFSIISQQLYLLEKEVEDLEFIISFNDDFTNYGKKSTNNNELNGGMSNIISDTNYLNTEVESDEVDKDSLTIINELCNRCPCILDILNLKNQMNQTQNKNSNEKPVNQSLTSNDNVININKISIIPIKNEDVSLKCNYRQHLEFFLNHQN